MLTNSLKALSRCLYLHFGRKVIILIDEYDVPLQKAKLKGYYEEMVGVIRGMFSSVLKTNDYLEKGILTGCLRITHESIFTGLNNFSTYTVDDEPYRDFIGFTHDEVHEMLKEVELSEHEEQIMDWYDGYNFCGISMLCPYSVLRYCSLVSQSSNPDMVRPQNFWANSSGNDILEICLKHPDEMDSIRLQRLLDGEVELIPNPSFTTYPKLDVNSSLDSLLGLMLYTGYVTTVERL